MVHLFAAVCLACCIAPSLAGAQVRISAMPISCFGPKRSVVSRQVDQSFRVKAIRA